MNLPKLLDDMWKDRMLFYRPDPLGYCIIISKMISVQKYNEMSVEERQRIKGYMK
jgi:hypothetical protein